MRLFVAINFSGELRARLWEATGPLRERDFPIRWVGEPQIHLTLKFLGEVANGEVAPIDRAVRAGASGVPPFGMRLGGLGGFPNLRNPRVLWVGVDASEPLEALHRGLEEALAGLGIERDRRAFRPHVTLGRARRGARRSDWQGLDEALGAIGFHGAQQVESLDLMRSRLSPKGARYERLGAHPLAAG